ncbi:MAG TPA: N-acetyltransferase [Gammaproteobacteria bacterium]|nr:N-acetyltransferase [Gammaproteobacteria bacterium]
MPALANALVRPAEPDDLEAISVLVNFYADLGNLLPRSTNQIAENLEHFIVAEIDSDIVGCASLELFTRNLGEIRSLMVDAEHQRLGIASNLIITLITRARDMDVKRVMALTYVPELFHKHDFRTVDKSIFPEKVWGICINCYKFHNCDEIAVLLEL